MIDYEAPFSEEFSADSDYWDNVPLPWNEEEEELNLEHLLASNETI